MKKHKNTNFRGITLIALVVTIVVLLILAGISISMLGGENGIIKQAVESKDKTKTGDEKEIVDLAATSAKIENNWGEITEENLVAELTQNIGERDVDYKLTTIGDKFKVTYIDTGNSYLVDKDGNTTECGPWHTEQGTDADGNKTLKVTNGKITVEVGDIIDYDPLPDGEEARTYTSEKTQTGCSDDQTFSSDYTGTWKVIGVSDEGQILISTTDLIKTAEDGYYYLKGRTAYIKAVSELDKISEIFGHGYGATGARSITIEDINRITGYNPNNTGVYDPTQIGSGIKSAEVAEGETKNLYEYGNEVTYYWKGDNYPHYTATNGLEGDLSDSHTTAFYWLDSNTKNWKSSPNATISPIATDISEMEKITTLRNNYYVYIPETLTSNSETTETVGLSTGSKAYNAIFANSSESTSGYCYWIGSPYVYTDTRAVDFGLRLAYSGFVLGGDLDSSDGGTYGGGIGVRPAVILKSDIQLKENSTDRWTIVKN